jgi:hypothetical protein
MEAIEGVLWSSRGPWLTLRDAASLKQLRPDHPETVRSPMDGEVIVHRSNVAYLQVLP